MTAIIQTASPEEPRHWLWTRHLYYLTIAVADLLPPAQLIPTVPST